jgi:hypothetical protein
MIPGCIGSWVDIKFIPATPRLQGCNWTLQTASTEMAVFLFEGCLTPDLRKTTLGGDGVSCNVILHGPFTGCLWALGNGLASRNVMEKAIQIDRNGYTWPRGFLFSIHWCITLIDSGCCFHCWFHTPDFTSCTTCVPWTRQTSVSSQHFVYHVAPRV